MFMQKILQGSQTSSSTVEYLDKILKHILCAGGKSSVHCCTAEKIIIVYITSSNRGRKVFATVKPVVTERGSLCTFWSDMLLNVTSVLEIILNLGFCSHHSLFFWQVTDENRNYFLSSPYRNMFLWRERVTEWLQRWHWQKAFVLPLKTSGEVSCETCPFVFCFFGPVLSLALRSSWVCGNFFFSCLFSIL